MKSFWMCLKENKKENTWCNPKDESFLWGSHMCFHLLYYIKYRKMSRLWEYIIMRVNMVKCVLKDPHQVLVNTWCIIKKNIVWNNVKKAESLKITNWKVQRWHQVNSFSGSVFILSSLWYFWRKLQRQMIPDWTGQKMYLKKGW